MDCGRRPRLPKICDLSDPPCENSAFSDIARLPTQRPMSIEHRPTKFCLMLEGLRGLLSAVIILGKFVPKNLPQLMLKF